MTILFLSGCSHSQIKKEIITHKEIAYNLFMCMKKQDTNCIEKAFLDKEDLKYKSSEILEDCKLVSKIASRNKVAIDSFKTINTVDGGTIVYCDLLVSADSLLNLKACRLSVYFFPKELNADPTKIFSYKVSWESLKKTEHKIIEAPLIEEN